MNQNTLRHLRKELAKLRGQARGGIPSEKLERFARSCGRNLSPRGKHPAWVSALLPKTDATPLSIPHHSRPIYQVVANIILETLESDLDKLEERYAKSQEHQNTEERND